MGPLILKLHKYMTTMSVGLPHLDIRSVSYHTCNPSGLDFTSGVFRGAEQP